MTPPASTEPMYLISESELLDLDGTSDDEIVFNAVRARGPVVAQQTALQMCDSFLDEIHDILKLDNDKVTDALVELYNLGLLWKERPDVKVSSGVAQPAPAAHYCTHLKWLTQIEGDGDYRCELGNKTSCEWCEGKSRCGDYQSVHDAALIAQEREKWERELRVDAQNPWCYPGCILVDKAKAQVREDVLDELAQMYANVPEQFLEGTYRLHSEWKEKIESLRHGQGREPE